MRALWAACRERQLKAAEQLVPPIALFLQDTLAVMVMEGLLNQIKLMRRQRISALKQIQHAAKHKLPSQEGASTEPRRVKPLLVQGEFAALSGALLSTHMPVQPTAMSMSSVLVPAQSTNMLVPGATSKVVLAEPPMVSDAPMMELLPEWQDEDFDNVPWFKDDLELMHHFNPIVFVY
ncbi:hypothetical protein C0992_011858 [Termitomyces sp. T32_za158]|nr:hypothetical protein C0992_011858 [Termitomyces sp. T32_za158]